MKHRKKYTHNPRLPYLKLPFKWEGTPVDENARFVNHEHPHHNSWKDFFKWIFMKNPQKEEKKNEDWQLPVLSDPSFINSDKDCIVWLGHASFFVRLEEFTLLIDPVFFNVSFIKRKSALPVNPDMFRELDYILVSHDHRDHCDKKSLKLLAKNNPDANYLTGLKLDSLIETITGSENIQAAGWYQQYLTKEVKISYVPSRHWGRRYIMDLNHRLWGGFVIQGNKKTIYFSGDSAYGSHFSDIASIFPQIDYCMIGIGAYKPPFIMEQSHLSPAQAIKAFADTKAKAMIPMHYGTFDLSDEPMSEPLKILRKIQQESTEINIRYLIPGEIELI